jgi:hypothetical protein
MKSNFSFPYMGFGYHGDNKSGTNQPLITTVTLRDFMEAVYKKQMDQHPLLMYQL